MHEAPSATSTDQTFMHTETFGEGESTLLVIPGWRLDSETEKPDWLPIMSERRNWRAVFIDLPGMGRSRADQAGINSQTDILDRLEAFAEEQGATARTLAVAGTSNGGALALGLSQRRPELVAGLAVRVPMLEPDTSRREVSGSTNDEDVLPDVPPRYLQEHEDKIGRLWTPARSRVDSEFLLSIRQDPSRYGLAEVHDADLRVEVPTLVVLGRQDGRIGWRNSLRRLESLPRSTVAVLDRAGHALPAGDRQISVWQALVHDWLDRVEEHAASRPEARPR